MTKLNIMQELFEVFNKQLEAANLITDCTVTTAPSHDSQPMPENVINMISERGTKVPPLSEEQQANNKKKSKVRCRIEHIFGFMTNLMHGITVRSIGIERATFNIGLPYNLRLSW